MEKCQNCKAQAEKGKWLIHRHGCHWSKAKDQCDGTLGLWLTVFKIDPPEFQEQKQ